MSRPSSVLSVIAVVVACGTHFEPQGPVLRDFPVMPPPARTEGPLSTRARLPDPPWPAYQAWLRRAGHVYLDRVALADDAARFAALIDELFGAGDTKDLAGGVAAAHRHAQLLAGFTWYPYDATLNAYQSATERLPVCVRPPDLRSACSPAPRATAAAPVPLTPPPRVAVTAGDDHIARVAIGELADPDDDAWRQLAVLGDARAILLDLRAATGSDPRPLIPWLEQLTGRSPLAPLRSITRPHDLDSYVADYAARYTDTKRDWQVWDPLVATAAPAASHAAPPIVVLVGPHCGAACELVARVLQTYAGAHVYGHPAYIDRLWLDEPARLELPHAKLEVFFFTTQYFLNADIEAATGPTSAWTLSDADDDFTEFAAHELAQRLAGVTPPRCDALPTYASRPVPPGLQGKLFLGGLPSVCGVVKTVTLRPNAPASALERFLATCAPPVALQPAFGATFFLPRDTSDAVLSQIAQSDVVLHVESECDQSFQPTTANRP